MEKTTKKSRAKKTKPPTYEQNTLEFYFKHIGKGPVVELPSGGVRQLDFNFWCSNEFVNYQNDVVELFYGMEFGFNDEECNFYEEGDILNKHDVEDFLLNRGDRSYQWCGFFGAAPTAPQGTPALTGQQLQKAKSKAFDRAKEYYNDGGKGACIVAHISNRLFRCRHIETITPEKFVDNIKEIIKDKPGMRRPYTIIDIFMEYEGKYTPRDIMIRNIYELRDNITRLTDELNKYKDVKDYLDYLKYKEELEDKNKKLEEENIGYLMKDNKIKLVDEWLNKNSENINFMMGKELDDILNK
jgi:hypothetical protein